MGNTEMLSATVDRVLLLDKRALKKRAITYIAFVYGFILIGWALSAIWPNSYSILMFAFSFYPLLANVLTRLVTKDKSPWMVKPNLRNNGATYVVAAFVPGALIFIGAALYFLIFPDHLDLSAIKLVDTYGRFGVPSNLPHTVGSIMKIGIVGVLVSPFVIPVAIFAFGEEIGWRGYLLPILVHLMNKKRAILLNGALWGVGHAPLISLGLNYGFGYWGAPYTGIVAMTLVCIGLGVWLSYVTIKATSVIPASVLHGSINVIGEFPALVAISGINPLLGPGPVGIIGMAGLLIGATLLFRKADVTF